MPDFSSLTSIYTVLAFIVPGLVVLFVRAQFLTGRSPTHAEALLSYLTMSIIYYSIVIFIVPLVVPLQSIEATLREAGYRKAVAWFLLIFIGPAVFGLLLGSAGQRGIIRKLVRKAGLYPVHVMPTAWDWKFGLMTESWVLVTLKNGTQFAGYFGTQSFASSDPKERDLYIEKQYDLLDDDSWLPRESGVLISAGEIQTVEIWPIPHKEEKDVE